MLAHIPNRAWLKIALIIAFSQVVLHYFCLSMASSAGAISNSQPDTLLYCQAAKQICGGQPFVFSPGDKPSTGTTGHLYPFVLAIPYALGATGDLIFAAGFILNAVFYLASVFFWALIAKKICGSKIGFIFAAILIALGCQHVSVALGQSDMGLWMAVTAALFAALAYDRPAAFGILLFLSPWCRPEGVILCGLALAYAIALNALGQKAKARKYGVIALICCASAAGTFIANYLIAGHFQYTSVMHKGHFKQHDFFSALAMTLHAMFTMIREILLGLSPSSPRVFYFAPLLVAAAALAGVFGRRWGRLTPEIAWFGAAGLAAMFIVASSGWQGTNMDRYLAWALPLWAIFAAEGLALAYRRTAGGAGKRLMPFLAIALMQIASAVALAMSSACGEQALEIKKDWTKRTDALLPPGASVATVSGDGYFAYYSTNRWCPNVYGLYSTDLITPEAIKNIDRLKHRRELRFQYCVTDAAGTFVDQTVTNLYRRTVSVAATGEACREMSWDAVDRALMPSIRHDESWRLVDSLDVGYDDDEERCGYGVLSSAPQMAFLYVAAEGVVAGTNMIVDVGRTILGADTMRISAASGKDLMIAMRVKERLKPAATLAGSVYRNEYDMGFPLRFGVFVDGVDAGIAEVKEPEARGDFCEFSITIPGRHITSDNPTLEIIGDRNIFAYWFYQRR